MDFVYICMYVCVYALVVYKEILGDVRADPLQEKVEYPGSKNVKKSAFFAYFAQIWAYDVMGVRGKVTDPLVGSINRFGIKRSSRHPGVKRSSRHLLIYL